MKKAFRLLGLAGGVAASLAIANPAMAQGYDRGDGDTAAIAVGAGIIGLALGAALADRDDNDYYDRRYYQTRRYVTVRGRPDYYYYYPGRPNRYYHDRYYGRPAPRYVRPPVAYYGGRDYRGHGWQDRDRYHGRDRHYDRGHDRRHDDHRRKGHR